MRLGTLNDLREALAGRHPVTGDYLIGRGYASALKQAAGMRSCARFDIDAVIKFRKENPDWKMTDVRKPRLPRSQKGQLGGGVGKSREP